MRHSGKSNEIERYQRESGAAAYQLKYRSTWIRRLDDTREHRIMSRLLHRIDHGLNILDVACGAGRFGELLVGQARSATFLDLSMPMLQLCRHAMGEGGANQTTFIRAGAASLPFRDDSFDLTVAVRLLHHFHDPLRRTELITELLRVARRWVILTFADRASLKGRQRRIRRRWLGRKRGEAMIERAEVLSLAAAEAFQRVTIVPISRLFSTQVYVLLERQRHTPERSRAGLCELDAVPCNTEVGTMRRNMIYAAVFDKPS
ncbi:MAG: class I SAM-dependent methyltransferase [Phycisphaerae bacterium]|nr:class I SAM-dependent methyltransferase [Phycisphaerae bacterium]